jgi:hypothetical protein
MQLWKAGDQKLETGENEDIKRTLSRERINA